jgi:hypothetical protein
VYVAPRQLERFLAQLRERNLELEAHAQDLDEAAREKSDRPRRRDLELAPEAAPAAPSASP